MDGFAEVGLDGRASLQEFHLQGAQKKLRIHGMACIKPRSQIMPFWKLA